MSRGIRVPDDIAIIGFDDIEDGRFTTPALSTIAPNKHTIATHAVARLSHLIANPASALDETTSFTLQPREST